ncbi:delta-60 repeat domain-containing protein [Pseudomonas salomonii]|uniref:Delta-60 repeat domain-containing protein n=1 Tax=Pseudomonas salomonii TaxID=191391 RepID=A0A1H3CYF3_9PSED|nr:delta-60 repeat domain-containing protein [Pseudomonas salomonii]SDX59147.1 delta-60 repeat domain-containing protein [Pseudomonas salomonii]
MNAANAPSQSGTHDPSFGVKGEITLHEILAGHPELVVLQLFKGLTTDKEGNILFCANFFQHGLNNIFGLGRLDANGKLDKAFGKDGLVTGNFAPSVPAGGSRLTVQPDGKILMLGWTWRDKGNGWADIVVARFESNGAFDTTFANQGMCTLLTHQDEGLTEDSTTVHVQNDGHILITANYSKRHNSYSTVGTVFRLKPNGELDADLNGNGRLDFKLENTAAATTVNACISQGDDHKIVIAGHARFTPTLHSAMFARLNHDGTLDKTFGDPQNPGVFRVQGITDHTTFNDLTERADRSLVGAGQVGMNYVEATSGLLCAITPNGAPHQLFNQGNPLVSQFNSAYDNGWYTIMNTGAGDLVTASSGNMIYVAKFNAGGAPDPAFNNQGYNDLDSPVRNNPVLLAELGEQRILIGANIVGVNPEGMGSLQCFFG